MLQRTVSNAKLVAAITLRLQNSGREALKTANQPIARDYTLNDTLESEDDLVEHWSLSEESENNKEGQNEPEPATVKQKQLITLT
jgi:hypothetical protein